MWSPVQGFALAITFSLFPIINSSFATGLFPLAYKYIVFYIKKQKQLRYVYLTIYTLNLSKKPNQPPLRSSLHSFYLYFLFSF